MCHAMKQDATNTKLRRGLRCEKEATWLEMDFEGCAAELFCSMSLQVVKRISGRSLAHCGGTWKLHKTTTKIVQD